MFRQQLLSVKLNVLKFEQHADASCYHQRERSAVSGVSYAAKVQDEIQ